MNKAPKIPQKKKIEILIVMVMILFLPTLILSTQWGYGSGYDEDEDEEYEYEREEERNGEYSGGESNGDEDEISEYLDTRRKGKLRNYSPSVEVARNKIYLQNCTDCHIGYSPNLLPERSWVLMMSPQELEDHFGEYIFLEEEDRRAILSYLVRGSAEKSRFPLAKKVNRSIPANETPLRISKVRAIYRQHQDIPDKYITQNARVLSLSQCSACHQQAADRGIYDEDDVFIPYERISKK